MKKNLVAIGVACSLFMGSASAGLSNFSYTGALSSDDTVQTFKFTVSSPSSVTLRTWSYAGGTNAAGNLIAEGGFDPILALFDSAGLKVTENDDGACSIVGESAVTGFCYDTYLTADLAAGGYTVSVAQFSNFAGATIDEPFPGSGRVNFDGRTNAWAFDILGVESAVQVGGAVPEPGSLVLLGLGLAGLAAGRRRKSV